MATQLFPQEKLQERYQALPPDIRTVLDSEDVGFQVDRISTAHDLLLDQTDVLAQEITYVLLGLRRPGDFVRALEERAQLKHTEAYQIGIEVEEIVFKPIRDQLYSMQDHDAYEPITSQQPTESITPKGISQELQEEHHEEEHHEIESVDQLLHEIENATDLPALTYPKTDFSKVGQAMTTPHISAIPPKAAPIPPKPSFTPPAPTTPPVSKPVGVTAQSFAPKPPVTPTPAAPKPPVAPTTPVPPKPTSTFTANESVFSKPQQPPIQPVTPKPSIAPAGSTLEIPKIRVMPGPGTLNLKPETSVPPKAAPVPTKPSFIQQEAGVKPPQPPKQYVNDPYREPII